MRTTGLERAGGRFAATARVTIPQPSGYTSHAGLVFSWSLVLARDLFQVDLQPVDFIEETERQRDAKKKTVWVVNWREGTVQKGLIIQFCLNVSITLIAEANQGLTAVTATVLHGVQLPTMLERGGDDRTSHVACSAAATDQAELDPDCTRFS